MERKVFPAFTVKVDADQGIVEHLISVFGILDEGKDIVHPGAFTKTIAERSGKIRVLDQHATDSINRVIGKPKEMREIGRSELPADVLKKWPEATGGLLAVTQYLMDTPEGKGAFTRIKEGAIDEYSFAFDALDTDNSRVRDQNGREVTARNIRTVKLYEYSPVIWGMNPATVTIDVKSDKPGKEMTPDGPVRRIGDVLQGTVHKIYTVLCDELYIAGKLDREERIKLSSAIGDALNALTAAIPADLANREWDQLAYTQEGPAELMQAVTTSMQAKENLTAEVDDVSRAFSEAFGTPNYYAYVREVFDGFVIGCVEGNLEFDFWRIPYTENPDGTYAFAPKTEWVGGDYAFIPGAKSTIKAGRVLAQRNAARIMNALRSLQEALADAGVDMAPEDDDEKTQAAPAEAAAELPEAGPLDRTHLELELAELELNQTILQTE